ncbi:glycosyltransferase family 4 protein [candidate division KSB1 bacterium]|nr:glycosyltransferase family 4 protein [candidate division KSB1 bacterium]
MSENQLKICMVGYTKYLHDGRLHRYSQSLIQSGHLVDVIGLGFKHDTRTAVIDGVRVFRIQNRDFSETGPLSYFKNLFTYFLKSIYFVTKMQLKMRYDVIHFHNIPDFGVFCTIPAKWMGAKIILDIHDLVPEFYMRKFNVLENHFIIRLLRVIEKISCTYTDRVITVTDLWKETLSKRSLNSDKCDVIMNVPIPDVFKPVPYVPHKKNDPFHLSYHGNLAEQTGVDLLLDAIALIQDIIPNITLQIIGEGRERIHLQEKMHDLRIDDVVTFKPVIPVTELPNQMSEIHVGVDPKRDGVYAGETLSVKSMEYLGMQIPLIVSKTKASEYYFDKDSVYFVEPENPNDLAHAIMDLYSHEKRRKQYYQNAERFNNRYNWQMMKERYLQMLNDLVHNKSKNVL